MRYYKELVIHTKLPETIDILNYFEISPTFARLQRYPYVTIWLKDPKHANYFMRSPNAPALIRGYVPLKSSNDS